MPRTWGTAEHKDSTIRRIRWDRKALSRPQLFLFVRKDSDRS